MISDVWNEKLCVCVCVCVCVCILAVENKKTNKKLFFCSHFISGLW